MNDEELTMLDECLNTDEGLSPWEMDFVEDLDKRRQIELSQKQHDKLHDIASCLP